MVDGSHFLVVGAAIEMIFLVHFRHKSSTIPLMITGGPIGVGMMGTLSSWNCYFQVNT